MNAGRLNRRRFLRSGLALAAGAPATLRIARQQLLANDASAPPPAVAPAIRRADTAVAVVSCRGYGPEVRQALDRSFDLLGGLGGLVKNRTVTVKLNLTGGVFSPFQGRPVGETYMTHYATALALANSLFAAGARRVRFVESMPRRADLRDTLVLADWDVRTLEAAGKVEFENTRNLGRGKSYAQLPVSGGGYVFSSLRLNQSYQDTDVMVSLAKLKNHVTAGVTLSMKNFFGLTPNSIYGDEAGREDAVAGRTALHCPIGYEHIKLPGLKDNVTSQDPTWRVPRITVDICAARPIHLAIIDGITSMRGGEGPWCGTVAELTLTTPGVLIVGLNPVSTDAVGTAVMGYDDPRAPRGTKPFTICDNHLLLAEQAGLGVAALDHLDLRGLPLDKARYPYG
jgi:uncharacterized protein (DUF362 family)